MLRSLRIRNRNQAMGHKNMSQTSGLGQKIFDFDQSFPILKQNVDY